MKSRTVQPIRRQSKKSGRNKNRKSSHNFGDTQPMRPIRDEQRPDLSDTQPMRPIGIRAGYREYQKVIDRRREVLKAPKPVPDKRYSRREKPAKSWTPGALRRALGKSIAKGEYFDFDMLFVIVFLMCFGLVMLYSASAYEAQVDVQLQDDMYYFSKQALIGVAGVVVMFLVSRVDYHIYGAFAFEIYVISMILMALVRSPLGVTLNGARRWIRLPGNLTLQPAEVTKIAVILFISYELCRLGKKASKTPGIIRVLAFGAIAAGGVMYLTDNLSTAIIVMAITCILIFVIHPKTRPFLIIIGVTVAVAAVLIAILAATAADSDNFRIQRIISWLNPEATADDGSFQVLQGLYAIGSGGFLFVAVLACGRRPEPGSFLDKVAEVCFDISRKRIGRGDRLLGRNFHTAGICLRKGNRYEHKSCPEKTLHRVCVFPTRRGGPGGCLAAFRLRRISGETCHRVRENFLCG